MTFQGVAVDVLGRGSMAVVAAAETQGITGGAMGPGKTNKWFRGWEVVVGGGGGLVRDGKICQPPMSCQRAFPLRAQANMHGSERDARVDITERGSHVRLTFNRH